MEVGGSRFLWELGTGLLASGAERNLPGKPSNSQCHFAEAVDARCSAVRWSNHPSGDAGCPCPHVPKVGVCPQQRPSGRLPSSSSRASGAVRGLGTQHRLRAHSIACFPGNQCRAGAARAFWRDWAAWGCLSHPSAIIPVRENQLHVERLSAPSSAVGAFTNAILAPKEKGCQASTTARSGRSALTDQCWEAAGTRGSPFFKPASSFPSQVSVPGDPSGGQVLLHLAQEGSGKAQGQQRYGKGSLLGGSHAPCWVSTAPLEHPPHGAALKSFLLSQVQRRGPARCCRAARRVPSPCSQARGRADGGQTRRRSLLPGETLEGRDERDPCTLVGETSSVGTAAGGTQEAPRHPHPAVFRGFFAPSQAA